MKAQSSHLLIFSVFQVDKTPEENLKAHKITEENMRMAKVPHIPVQGSYRNTKELGFIVPVEQRDLVKSLCHQYKQESYLEHHKDRHCELVFTDFRLPLGTMVETTKEKAEASEAYTLTPDGRYFITEK